MFYGSNVIAISCVYDSNIILERAHSSTVPDQVTTYNLGEEAAACGREEEEEGHAEVHREVEAPAVGSSVEEPHVDGHQEEEAPAVDHLPHRAIERLALEVAAWHDLPISTAVPAGNHRNFLVAVQRNFHLRGAGGRLGPVNATLSQDKRLTLAEAARKNNSAAAYPAVRILVDLACLASVEVARS
jgi:hypothetical protein